MELNINDPITNTEEAITHSPSKTLASTDSTSISSFLDDAGISFMKLFFLCPLLVKLFSTFLELIKSSERIFI